MVQCYYKSGNPALTKPAPCNLTAVENGEHTSCCAPDELCMDNGLCRNATSTPRTNFYWRGGCTDPTFQDPVCPNYCNLKNPWEDQLIWQCSNDEYCCNNGGAAPEEQRYDRTNLTCCTISEYTFSAASPSLIATATYLGEVFTVGGTVSTTLSTPTSQPESSSTSMNSSPSATSSNSASASPPSRSKTSAAAIGAGAGVGALALIVICAAGFWWYRKRLRRAQAETSSYQAAPAELVVPDYRTEMPMEKYRAELESNVEPSELYGGAGEARGK